MPLPNVVRDPSLRCEATKRNGERCRGIKAYSTSRCTHHGANRGKKQYGQVNGNYKTGSYTEQEQNRHREVMERIKMLTKLAKQLGMINQKR